MNKQRIKILTAVTFGVIALAICLSTFAGESPVSEVILESTSRTVEGQDYWEGPATIWLDGVMYDGTVLYMHEGGTMDDNRWYGVETQNFDFGDLGTLTVSGIAITTFDYISPNHRWHHYTSHTRITNGTGAFAEANGVLLFRGYTDWETDPQDWLPHLGLRLGWRHGENRRHPVTRVRGGLRWGMMGSSYRTVNERPEEVACLLRRRCQLPSKY